MNILHLVVTLSPLHGGPSRVVPAMCSALTKKGHRAEIITTTWTGRAEASNETGPAVPITYHDVSWPRSFGTSWSLAAEVGRRISEFDVVHVHQVYFFHGVVASTVSSKARVPMVISPHGVFHPFHKNKNPLKKSVYTYLVERRNLSKAAGFHFSSTAERDHATETGLMDGGYVIPFAVDLRPDCDVAPFLELHPGLSGKILVTFLGRLTAIKRLDLVIDAFAKVATEHSEAHLVIAGPDSEGLGSALRARVEARGIGPLVSFVGVVTGEVRDALLASSRMLLLTSENESFGVSAVEGMAAGLPVIVSGDVAVQKEIASADAGFVVERSPESIAAAIRSLMDSNTHQRMSAKARTLVANTFAPATMADRLEDMYRSLIERGAG
jgi:glycosyltransferase involved in cell wall biosynthesis